MLTPENIVVLCASTLRLHSASDEQKEIFEKFHDCWSEYMSLAEAAIFEYAFKLGAKFMLECMTDHN